MNEKDHLVGLLTSNLRTTSGGDDKNDRVTGVERGEGRWGSRNCGRRRNDGRKNRHRWYKWFTQTYEYVNISIQISLLP